MQHRILSAKSLIALILRFDRRIRFKTGFYRHHLLLLLWLDILDLHFSKAWCQKDFLQSIDCICTHYWPYKSCQKNLGQNNNVDMSRYKWCRPFKILVKHFFLSIVISVSYWIRFSKRIKKEAVNRTLKAVWYSMRGSR